MIAPAIWSSMLSWCTPAVLFVLLNVAIATIFFFSNSQKHEPKQPNHSLTRTSSLYETFKSFNLYRQNTQDPTCSPINPPPHEPEPHQLTRTSSIFDTLKSFNPYHQNTLTQDPTINAPPHEPEPRQLTRTSSLLEALKSFALYRQNTQDLTTTPQDTEPKSEPHDQSHLSRIQSDTHPTAGEVPQKLSHNMKKSASEKSSFDHFRDEGVVSDRGPLTERSRPVTRGDEGVDAKADDFINKFKQQLKLQRLDSILRYKEMLNRGK
ncbi:hypothetical protein AAC387_Pa02g2782 [Persea americana]